MSAAPAPADVDPGLAIPARPTSESAFRRAWRTLKTDPVGVTSVLLFLFIVAAAAFGPMILSASPTEPDIINRLKPPVWLDGGTWALAFGTDALGRDMLARLLYSARASLLIGATVVVVAGTVGVTLGLISGYRGGWLGSFIMRRVDTQVAFPGLLLALLILDILGASATMVVIVLSINGWMVYARMTRGVVLGLKEAPFVQAAETVGASPFRVVTKYLVPNIASPLLTLATLEFARIVLAEASLSYLGLGIQPPGASWGLMIAEGQEYLTTAWWTITEPGLAIAITVLSLNLMASWLRVAADPQQREKRFVGSATEPGV
jgi:peptide/nickel transport system permease protein